MPHQILAIPGALRQASTNRKLLAEAQRLFGPSQWQTADLNLPLYDGDVETAQGIPAKVQTLAQQIASADGIIIATPEYNKSLPGVLKNALDWVSRVKAAPWRDKPVAIVSAADGRGGGDRAQFALRLCLTPFRPRLITGPELAVADAADAFDENGQLKDARYIKAMSELLDVLKAEIIRTAP